MKVLELLTESQKKYDLIDMLEDFLPLAKEELGIEKIPPIKLVGKVDDESQPTFGRYDKEEEKITLAILNRHPIDILRTLAHELVHYRQDMNNELGPHSGKTGSPQENEAHQLAGVIMRNFNKSHPQYLELHDISLVLAK